MPRGSRTEGVVLGVLLIALGVLWTLGNLGQIDLLRTLRTWWPLAFVVWGAVELVGFLAARASGRSSR